MNSSRSGRDVRWLRAYEGIWSLKRSMANFAAADQARPGPHHQAQAEEDPVPAPPDRRLPGRHRPENRALVTLCTTSSIWFETWTRQITRHVVRCCTSLGEQVALPRDELLDGLRGSAGDFLDGGGHAVIPILAM